jgi:phosphoribosylformylglycinamidine synthase
MAANAIDEAVRNIIAVGGNLNRLAILDNFCWGNCFKEDRMGALVLAAQACYDVAITYGTPFISGKDSLNNEFNDNGKNITIPHTLLISAISVIDDINKCLTMDFKKAGNSVYLIGATKEEFGGSHYNEVIGVEGGTVPTVYPGEALKLFNAVIDATDKSLIASLHDLSEGGLAVAVAEMAFAGELGAKLDFASLKEQGNDETLLFSESASRFIAEVSPENEASFLATLEGLAHYKLGETIPEPTLSIKGINGESILSSDIFELKTAWQAPLDW